MAQSQPGIIRLLFAFGAGALIFGVADDFRICAQNVTLDQTWTVKVAGQLVQVNADGSFVIPNIAAPDQFGPGGPGTQPDFLSDTFLRLVGYSTAGGTTRYVFSEPFQIRQRTAFVISNLTFSLRPPPFPESIAAIPAQPTLTQTGQTVQVRVTGTLIDGSTIDVTPRSAATTYRSSNPEIASVDPNGLVTARDKGMVFITAVNEGAASVTQIDVSPGDPLTTVRGLVQDRNGAPVTAISVTLIGLAGTAATAADGSFNIAGVATQFGIRGVIARTLAAGGLFGFAGRLDPVLGGETDAGIITVVPCQQLTTDCRDTDNDCLPDIIETSLGLNPNVADTDRDGITDGDEDADNDGLPNCVEFILRTNSSRADSDSDGLADGQEVFTVGSDPANPDSDFDSLRDGEEVNRGTNPLIVDSDFDGWNDESEVTGGSDPKDRASRPRLMIVARPPLGLGLPRLAPGGLLALGTTRAYPPVAMWLPVFSGRSETASGTTIAVPPIRLGLPAFVSAEGGTRNVTIGYPPISIGLPAFFGPEQGAPGTTIAKPPVKVGFQ